MHNFNLVPDSTSLLLFVLCGLKLHSNRAIKGCGKHAPFGKCVFNFEFSQRKCIQTGGWEPWRIVAGMGEKRTGSGSSKTKRIGREIQNANFCHPLSVQILSKAN